MKKGTTLYDRVRQILESARSTVSRSVNSTQVAANWLIGEQIVEEEQNGKFRAGYGKQVLQELSTKLQTEYGNGYAVDNLELFRRFYREYPALIPDAVRRISGVSEKSDALRRISRNTEKASQVSNSIPFASVAEIGHAVRGQSWKTGQMHPSLSWTHYRRLLRVQKPEARAFYEIESIQNNWAARELERQICSLLYERLALSRDKKGLMRLATKGQEVQKPGDIFKDPVVIEFTGLPESPKLVETDLETALINNLQSFLLELGKGFAFVARQERLTLDGDHFYIDLVFYHTILKCYVIIDLKTGKLTHQDLGQLQLYVNYYDREKRTAGDNPTLGLILCADKNDAVVRYTLGDAQQKIFASKYKLFVPSVAELQAEIKREVREFGPDGVGGGKV
jgi:predicted nuclease of restriction endonuclease-like (RecB) superfamily